MKLKTNSGVKKRFKITGTGKVMKRKVGMRHKLTKKGKNRKNSLKHGSVLNTVNASYIKKLLIK